MFGLKDLAVIRICRGDAAPGSGEQSKRFADVQGIIPGGFNCGAQTHLHVLENAGSQRSDSDDCGKVPPIPSMINIAKHP